LSGTQIKKMGSLRTSNARNKAHIGPSNDCIDTKKVLRYGKADGNSVSLWRTLNWAM
jgi:hypothetical protein